MLGIVLVADPWISADSAAVSLRQAIPFPDSGTKKCPLAAESRFFKSHQQSSPMAGSLIRMESPRRSRSVEKCPRRQCMMLGTGNASVLALSTAKSRRPA
jgi:hypothetical protein